MSAPMDFKPEWRRILKARSVKDKFAVFIDCDTARPGDLNIISELVREGLIVWMERTVLPFFSINETTGSVTFGVNVDVYGLTLNGIKLCDENGIEQR